MIRAKALYNNVADTAEELTFDAGDVLTVLETNVTGAPGWWLCSFGGRTGIAPGNRLRVMRQQDVGCNGTPTTTTTQKPNLQVPHKSGNVYVYDKPQGADLDYDVPPPRYTPSPVVPSVSTSRLSPKSMMDSSSTLLTGNRQVGAMLHMQEATYDSPPSLNRANPSLYDVPPALSEAERMSSSNRSSVLSMLSTGSRSSAASFLSGSSSSMSARSSVDVSIHEIYDIPRASAEQKMAAAKACLTRGNSVPLCGSGSSALHVIIDRDSYLDDYSVPRSMASPELVDSGIAMSKLEMKSDGCGAAEIYDMPKSLTTSDEGCVYDIPPTSQNSGNVSDEGSSSSATSARCSTETGVCDSVQQVASCEHCKVVSKRDSVQRAVDGFLATSNSNNRSDVHQWCKRVAASASTLRTFLQEFFESCRNAAGSTEMKARSNTGDVFQRVEYVGTAINNVCQQLERVVVSFQNGNAVNDLYDDYFTNVTGHVTGLQSVILDFCLVLFTFIPVTCSSYKKSTEKLSCVTSSNSSLPSRVRLPLSHGRPPTVLPKPHKSLSPRSSDIQDRPLPLPPGSKQSLSPAVSLTSFSENEGRGDASAAKQAVQDTVGDDYDYVAIACEAEKELQQNYLPAACPSASTQQQDIQLASCDETDTAIPVNDGVNAGNAASSQTCLGLSDQELISFYAEQVHTHVPIIESAITNFYRHATSTDVSPEVFVQRSKLVVLAAHKLVYIADTIARHATNDTVCHHTATAANTLCNCLKSVVVATKESALMAPHNAALRLRAVDSVRAAAVASQQLMHVIDSFLMSS